MNSQLISYLFKTKAIRVCPGDKPFWYTSGKIGPYYVNTHFLFGSEEAANDFLKQIDQQKEDIMACSHQFFRTVLEHYEQNEVFRGTIDAMAAYAKEKLPMDEVDYISGGERRDWFFSFMMSHLFKKPHITLFKDGQAVLYEKEKSRLIDDLKGASVLHIADLITTASSYERAWVPAINKLNGNMKWSLVVVDRLQGGAQILEGLGVASHNLVAIDEAVFTKACQEGYISEEQLKLVLDYMKDADASMAAFIKQNPGFLKDALRKGGKEAERANLMLQSNFYGVRELMD
jgi:orotate phosphoribosyltransferase